MIDLIKETYVLKDYGVKLHRRKKSLKQKDMDVSLCTKEFLKLCMKTNMVEDEEEKLARYINGLKVPIQEEPSLHFPTIVNKCYQMALKVEEKRKRKQDFSKRTMIVGRILEARKIIGIRDKVVAVATRSLTREKKKIVTLMQEETIEGEELSIEGGKM